MTMTYQINTLMKKEYKLAKNQVLNGILYGLLNGKVTVSLFPMTSLVASSGIRLVTL